MKNSLILVGLLATLIFVSCKQDLTTDDLKTKDALTANFLRIGDEEQYRTTNEDKI